MNTPILTTRDTNKISKVFAIISGILDILFAVFILNFFKKRIDAVPGYMRDDYTEAISGLIALVAIALAASLFYAAYQFVICRSYVDVYENRLEGKGIQNVYQIVDFNLSYDNITSVTCRGLYIHIQTPGGKFKILSNAETAQKVYSHCCEVLVR